MRLVERWRRRAWTPARLVMYTEVDRQALIEGRLIGPKNEELARATGTNREDVIRRLKVAALYAALAHDWTPELVDEGGL